VSKRLVGGCLAIIALALFAHNAWRLNAPGADRIAAAGLYGAVKAALPDESLIGVDFSPMTTTLGSLTAKRSSLHNANAALVVAMLKKAGLRPGATLGVNASGSFPGFVFATLAACAVLGLDTVVVASLGASTYGANVPGNTLADMLLTPGLPLVAGRDYILAAVTPGGSDDRGAELDEGELQRVAALLAEQGIPFLRPQSLAEAIALRRDIFAHCNILVTIGGNHASVGNDGSLALRAGLINAKNYCKTGESLGLIQAFLAEGKPVIQLLNTRRLYRDWGLRFNEAGELISGEARLYRRKLP
jgi:poly-gamma-glutamate system protein